MINTLCELADTLDRECVHYEQYHSRIKESVGSKMPRIQWDFETLNMRELPREHKTYYYEPAKAFSYGCFTIKGPFLKSERQPVIPEEIKVEDITDDATLVYRIYTKWCKIPYDTGSNLMDKAKDYPVCVEVLSKYPTPHRYPNSGELLSAEQVLEIKEWLCGILNALLESTRRGLVTDGTAMELLWGKNAVAFLESIPLRFWDELNLALRSCGEGGTHRSALTGKLGIQHKGPAPEVQVGNLGQVKLMSCDSANRPMHRYGKHSYEVFPTNQGELERLGNALKWISSPEKRSKSWESGGKDTVVVVYSAKGYPVIDDAASVLCGSFVLGKKEKGNTSAEANFIEKSRNILSKYRKRERVEDPAIRQFVVEKRGKQSFRIVDDMIITESEWNECVDDWVEGCGCPDAGVISIRRAFGLMKTAYKHTATNKIEGYDVGSNGIHYSDLLDLWWGKADESSVRDMLIKFLDQATPVLHARDIKEVRFHFYDTLAFLRLLCHKLGFGLSKGRGMKSVAYLMGTVCANADRLQRLYSEVVRKEGLIETCGFVAVRAISERPDDGLAELGESCAIYVQWAENYVRRGEGDKMFLRIKGALKRYKESVAALAEFDLPTRLNYLGRAHLWLGYHSAPKKTFVSEDATEEKNEEVNTNEDTNKEENANA